MVSSTAFLGLHQPQPSSRPPRLGYGPSSSRLTGKAELANVKPSLRLSPPQFPSGENNYEMPYSGREMHCRQGLPQAILEEFQSRIP